MPTLNDVREAADRIAPIAHQTPVLTSRTFNARSGVEAFFKAENFQRGGAFKIRGAANFIYSIPKDEVSKGVVTYSSGNHAQAVAIAAQSVGAPAVIVMPDDAPKSKVAATRGYGAQVLTYDRMRESREEIGARIARESGATIVPPYDHEWTLIGQGTLALELMGSTPDLDAFVTCIGGGGMLAGCSIAARALNPKIRIFGVEPELANDTWLSFRRGERVGIEPPPTIADGLRAQKPGEITFPIIQRNVEDILLVSEDEIRETMRFFLTRMKIVVEPSAVAAAAVLFRQAAVRHSPRGHRDFRWQRRSGIPAERAVTAMACPFFLPLARLDNQAWSIPPRLPLGDPFAGECHATPEPATPDDTMLRQYCNRGYGRGHCPRFPEHSEADAVRFHRLEQGGILYIFEKDCWPVRHGIAGETGDAILERQAAAFAESYARRAGAGWLPYEPAMNRRLVSVIAHAKPISQRRLFVDDHKQMSC